jgi:hypothetical protein
MATGDDVKELNLRLTKLEQAIGGLAEQRSVTNLTADEIKAYQKVRDVMAANWGDFCGINDCFRCVVVRCLRCYTPLCRRCDIECSCGPCAIGTLGGGLQRFSDLGE